MERTWKRGTRRKGKESRTSRARNIHPSRVYNAGTDEAPCATVNFSLSLSSLQPTFLLLFFFSSSFSSFFAVLFVFEFLRRLLLVTRRGRERAERKKQNRAGYVARSDV